MPAKLQTLGGLYTVEGAANALGTTYWAVYMFIRHHRIPTTRLGKSVLVRLTDLEGMRHREQEVTMTR